MLNINPELERIIFEEMGAKYLPQPESATSNLENTESDNLKYLGTYFPRSFVESFHIYDNIFNNQLIFDSLNSKSKIRILDIGSGTGGSIIGLINLIDLRFEKKEIIIYSIDGNQDALNIQKSLFKKRKEYLQLNNKYKLKIFPFKFETKANFQSIMNDLEINKKFDLIQTFKFINEFYNRDYEESKGFYEQFLKFGENLLVNDGLLIIEDLTYYISPYAYLPAIMNNECKNYFRTELTDLVYILPKCCALWHIDCQIRRCFSKLIYEIKHREANSDISKINYKLFIKGELGTYVLNSYSTCDCYRLDYRTFCTKYGYHYNCYVPPLSPDECPFTM